ncbi:MAG: PadR family transcriptional regulator [Propioniciclava sp.]
MVRTPGPGEGLRRGVIELAVLGLLADGPRYGLQIVEELSRTPALAVPAGTVYPLVSRLLSEGLIASRWQEAPQGPPRKYYRLTSAGTKRLTVLNQAWQDLRAALDDLLEEIR